MSLFVVGLRSGEGGRWVDRCYNCSVSVFVKGNRGWDDVAVVGVVFVRVVVRNEGGWILGVKVIGHCVVVCCDCTVDVKVEGVEMTSWGAYAGVVMLCGRGVVIMDAGVVLTMNVSFYLVVNVQVPEEGGYPGPEAVEKLES